MCSRDGEVRMKAVKKARRFDIQLFLDRNVEKGSTISTDEALHYKSIQGYNKIHTLQRMENLCKAVKGKRLSYKQLTK